MVRFGELVEKLKDIVSNRLVRNQQLITALPLAEMPEKGTTLPLDKFVAMQEKHVKTVLVGYGTNPSFCAQIFKQKNTVFFFVLE